MSALSRRSFLGGVAAAALTNGFPESSHGYLARIVAEYGDCTVYSAAVLGDFRDQMEEALRVNRMVRIWRENRWTPFDPNADYLAVVDNGDETATQLSFRTGSMGEPIARLTPLALDRQVKRKAAADGA